MNSVTGQRKGKPAAVLLCLFSILIYLQSGCTREVTLTPSDVLFPWEVMEELVFPGRITCMDVAEDGMIFLGYYSYESGFRASGVLISGDRGETWTDKEIGSGRIVDLSIDNNGVLFATGDDGMVCTSSDRGSSWKCHDEVFSDSPADVYSTTGRDGGVLVWSYRESIYFTSDSGETWEAVSDTVPGEWLERLVIGKDSRICAQTQYGLYCSDDTCRSWVYVDKEWNSNEVRGLAVDADGDFLALFRERLIRSSDGGETWDILYENVDHYLHSLWADRTGRLFYGSNDWRMEGLFLSLDQGQSWNLIADCSDSFTSVELAFGPLGEIYMITKRSGPGFCRSVDNGENWSFLGFPERDPLSILPHSDGSVYVSLDGAGIFRSADANGGWECFEPGNSYLSSILLAEDCNGEIILSAFGDVYRYEPNLQQVAPLSEQRLSRVISIDLSGWPVVYCGTDLDGVSSLEAYGGSWKNLGLRDYQISAVVTSVSGQIYAACNFGGTFRYDGESDLWDQMNEGFEDLFISSMVEGPGGVILAGSQLSGVYILDEEHETWQRISDQDIYVTSILVHEDTFVIVTRDSGIYYYRQESGELLELYDYLNGTLADRIDQYVIHYASIDREGFLYLLIETDILKSRYSIGDIDRFLR